MPLQPTGQIKESPAAVLHSGGIHGSALTDLSPTPYRLVPRPTNPLTQTEQELEGGEVSSSKKNGGNLVQVADFNAGVSEQMLSSSRCYSKAASNSTRGIPPTV